MRLEACRVDPRHIRLCGRQYAAETSLGNRESLAELRFEVTDRGPLRQELAGDDEVYPRVVPVGWVSWVCLRVGSLHSRGERGTGNHPTGQDYRVREPPAVVLNKDHMLHVGDHDLAVKVNVHGVRLNSALDDACIVLLVKERADCVRPV